jgi:hypothetical protein
MSPPSPHGRIFLKGDPKVVSEGLSLSASFLRCDFLRVKGKIYQFLRGGGCANLFSLINRDSNFTDLIYTGGAGAEMWILNGIAIYSRIIYCKQNNSIVATIIQKKLCASL